MDYVADSILDSVTFAPWTTEQCFSVTIVNDIIAERQEQISISFQRDERDSVDATAEIAIVDDDGIVGKLVSVNSSCSLWLVYNLKSNRVAICYQ